MPPGADADLPPDVAVLDLSRSTTVDISLSQYSITSNKSFSASRYLGRSRNEIVPLGTSTRNLMLLQAEALFPQPEISNQQEQIEWKFVDPPDTPFSWMMLLCCCLIRLADCSLLSTSGIFLVEFMDVFGEGQELTSWVCTLQQSLMFVLGPLAGILTDRLGHRPTLIIGCTGAGLSLAVASMTSNFKVLFLTFGISAGAFSSCVTIPATVGFVDYFQKYKVLALTITGSVFPIAQLIFPHMVTSLIENFGWRYANLALAAVFIQSIVFATLLRPQRLKKLSTPLSGDSAWYTSTTSGFGKLRKDSSSHYTESQYSLYGEDTGKHSMYLLKQDSLADKLHESHTVLRSDYTIPTQLKTNSKIYSIEKREQNKFGLYLTKMFKSMRQSPFCHWRLFVVVAYNFMLGIGSSVFFILLPSLATYLTFTSSQVTQLFMLSGAVGFAGRLSAVAFCRLMENASMAACVAASLAMQSAALVGASLAESFICLAIMASLISFAYGVTLTLATSTILEMHGDQNLAVVYGLQMMLYGTGYSVSAPFAAWLYMLTNSYSVGFQCAAAVNFTGCLLLLPHIIQRYRKSDYADTDMR